MDRGDEAALAADLVLIGGGHAHVQVLGSLANRPVPGLRVTLVTDVLRAPYSGMLPAILAGEANAHDGTFDLVRLCHRAQARLLHSACSGISLTDRVVRLMGRSPGVHFDILSINVGILPRLPLGAEGPRHLAVKPIARLLEAIGDWAAVADQGQGAAVPPDEVRIVGGGISGCEVALALAKRWSHAGRRWILLCGSADILPGGSARARRLVRRELDRVGISVLSDFVVERARDDGSLLAADGRELGPAARVVWATAASSPPWIEASGLSVDEGGFLRVDERLRVSGQERVFGAGDCIAFAGRSLPKAGVYAVREGPVLSANLRQIAMALLSPKGGARLCRYRPQKRALALIRTGPCHAVATWGPIGVGGAWVARWKERIDRRFMIMWQNAGVMPDRDSRTEQSSSSAPFPRRQGQGMVCVGCGAKAPAAVVRGMLQSLGGAAGSGADDAAIIREGARIRLESIDGMSWVSRDPWVAGEVAAVHALSDIWAMGAAAKTLQCAVTLEEASGSMMASDLGQFMGGVLRVCRDSEVDLLGGHTMRGRDTSVVITVSGYVESESDLWHKGGAAPGDVLILTKALGTGAALEAVKTSSGLDAEGWTELLGHLRTTHRDAVEILRGRVRCATDVTGWGLCGHLMELAGPGAEVEVSLRALPRLRCFGDAIRLGARPPILVANREYFARSWDVAGAALSTEDEALIHDPQTSGGLLVAVAASDSKELVGRLRAVGYASCAAIGRVTSAGRGRGRLIVGR